LSSQPSWL